MSNSQDTPNASDCVVFVVSSENSNNSNNETLSTNKTTHSFIIGSGVDGVEEPLPLSSVTGKTKDYKQEIANTDDSVKTIQSTSKEIIEDVESIKHPVAEDCKSNESNESSVSQITEFPVDYFETLLRERDLYVDHFVPLYEPVVAEMKMRLSFVKKDRSRWCGKVFVENLGEVIQDIIEESFAVAVGGSSGDELNAIGTNGFSGLGDDVGRRNNEEWSRIFSSSWNVMKKVQAFESLRMKISSFAMHLPAMNYGY